MALPTIPPYRSQLDIRSNVTRIRAGKPPRKGTTEPIDAWEIVCRTFGSLQDNSVAVDEELRNLAAALNKVITILNNNGLS